MVDAVIETGAGERGRTQREQQTGQVDKYHEFVAKLLSRKKGKLVRYPDGSTEFIAVDDETYEMAKEASEGHIEPRRVSQIVDDTKDALRHLQRGGLPPQEQRMAVQKINKLRDYLANRFEFTVPDPQNNNRPMPIDAADYARRALPPGDPRLERVLQYEQQYAQLRQLINDLNQLTNGPTWQTVVANAGQIDQVITDIQSLGGPDVGIQMLDNVFWSNVLENNQEYRDTQNPQNWETVIVLMAKSSDARYQEGGDMELYHFNPKTGLYEINFVNVTKWVREKMTFWSDLNDDDPIQLYEALRFDTTFRSITFFELLAYDPGKYFRPQDNDPVKHKRYQRYSAFLIEMLTPYGHIHNFAVEHLMARSNLENFGKHLENMAQNKLFFNSRFLRGLNMVRAEDIEKVLNGDKNAYDPREGGFGDAAKDILAAYDSILEFSNHNLSFASHDAAMQDARTAAQAGNETARSAAESRANAFLDVLGADAFETPIVSGRTEGRIKVKYGDGDWVWDETANPQTTQPTADTFVDRTDPQNLRVFRRVEPGKGNYIVGDVDQLTYIQTTGREIFAKEVAADVLKYKIGNDTSFSTITLGQLEVPESATRPGQPAQDENDIRTDAMGRPILIVAQNITLQDAMKSTDMKGYQFFQTFLENNMPATQALLAELNRRGVDTQALVQRDYGKFLQDVLNMKDGNNNAYGKWGSQSTMNIFYEYAKEPRTRRQLVRHALKETMRAKYKLSDIDAGTAEEYMSLVPYFMLVAANNDTNQQGFDWPARIMHLTDFWESQARHNAMGVRENWNVVRRMPTLLDGIKVMTEIERPDGTTERKELTFNEVIRRKSRLSGDTFKLARTEFSEEAMTDIIKEPVTATIELYKRITSSADIVDASKAVFAAAYNTGRTSFNSNELAKIMKFTDFMRRLFDKYPYLYKHYMREHVKARDAQGRVIANKWNFETVQLQHAIFGSNVFTLKEGIESLDASGQLREDLRGLSESARLARAAEAGFHVATMRMYTNVESGMPQRDKADWLEFYIAGLASIPMGYRKVSYRGADGRTYEEDRPYGKRWSEEEILFMIAAAGVDFDKEKVKALVGGVGGAGLDFIWQLIAATFSSAMKESMKELGGK